MPHFGSALWLAPRAELGLGVPMTAQLMLVLRAGAAVPLGRPEFVADSVPVHRASRVSGRATLGVEVGF
jgi:hypothetical protein